MARVQQSFFTGDVLDIAPTLLGKFLVRQFENGEIVRFRILETEAYRGMEDKGCHASKGRTPRTEVMFQQGGLIYVYLIYGLYWMLNFVTSGEGYPAAALIRSLEGIKGPGRVGKELRLDKSFNGENLADSKRLWVEEDGTVLPYSALPRIGIDYAGHEWALKPWRFTALNHIKQK